MIPGSWPGRATVCCTVPDPDEMSVLTQLLSCDGLLFSCACDGDGVDEEDIDSGRYCGGGGWSMSVASKSKKAKKKE